MKLEASYAQRLMFIDVYTQDWSGQKIHMKTEDFSSLNDAGMFPVELKWLLRDTPPVVAVVQTLSQTQSL